MPPSSHHRPLTLLFLSSAILAALAGAWAVSAVRSSNAPMSPAEPPAHHAAPELPTPDFTARLPVRVGIAEATQALQRRSLDAGFRVVAMSVAEDAADAHRLGRVRWNVTLRGSYPSIRAVLQDPVGVQFPITMNKLRLSRIDDSAEIQAEVEWWLAARPRR